VALKVDYDFLVFLMLVVVLIQLLVYHIKLQLQQNEQTAQTYITNLRLHTLVGRVVVQVLLNQMVLQQVMKKVAELYIK